MLHIRLLITNWNVAKVPIKSALWKRSSLKLSQMQRANLQKSKSKMDLTNIDFYVAFRSLSGGSFCFTCIFVANYKAILLKSEISCDADPKTVKSILIFFEFRFCPLNLSMHRVNRVFRGQICWGLFKWIDLADIMTLGWSVT